MDYFKITLSILKSTNISQLHRIYKGASPSVSNMSSQPQSENAINRMDPQPIDFDLVLK